MPQVADAEAKQLQLDRMKRRATGLLVVMSAVFLAALVLEARYPGLGYVRATAEAAMVGGLADWFAITALFKHPLNIPIPHTAIIPTRKDRIGRTLGNFVQHNGRDLQFVRINGTLFGGLVGLILYATSRFAGYGVP
ncbi:MAG: DUF445 family protein [Gemmatimonadales bacterium]|nr:DUF445 family protein [Gemmatimonadales bacterium]